MSARDKTIERLKNRFKDIDPKHLEEIVKAAFHAGEVEGINKSFKAVHEQILPLAIEKRCTKETPCTT